MRLLLCLALLLGGCAFENESNEQGKRTTFCLAIFGCNSQQTCEEMKDTPRTRRERELCEGSESEKNPEPK